MNIAQQLWNKTHAHRVISLFPGDIDAFLTHLDTPSALLTAQEHIHMMFWRWMHLEHTVLFGSTPSLTLDDIRLQEGWPATGQFLPTATLAIAKQKFVDISVTLDFIDFNEQPIIHDLLHVQKHTLQTYPWGPDYTSLMEHIRSVVGPMIEKKQLTTLETSYATCHGLFQYNLSQWYDERPYIRDVFTPNTWESFWETQLKAIGSPDGLSTDVLLDAYTGAMRRVFPNFSLTNKELGAYRLKAKELPNVQFMAQYEFWLSFGKHILIPLSLHLQLLEPVYIDRKNFAYDVDLLLGSPTPDAYSLFGPCTHLYLTDFGQLFLASFHKGMYKELIV